MAGVMCDRQGQPASHLIQALQATEKKIRLSLRWFGELMEAFKFGQ